MKTPHLTAILFTQLFIGSQVLAQNSAWNKYEAAITAQNGEEASPDQVEQELLNEGVEVQNQTVEVDPKTNMPAGPEGVALGDKVLVKVYRDLSPQFAEVYMNGEYVHSYWVSTGTSNTPSGSWTVYEANWNRVSRTYNNSPMTGALMYSGGYAIHMTPYTGFLGRRASKGCVRMEDAGLYKIWTLMGGPRGKSNVTVQVLAGKHHVGKAPAGKAPSQGGKMQAVENSDKAIRPEGGRLTGFKR